MALTASQPVLGTASILLVSLIGPHPKTQQGNLRLWAMLHPETDLPQYTIYNWTNARALLRRQDMQMDDGPAASAVPLNTNQEALRLRKQHR